jgi:hypothetical protein
MLQDNVLQLPYVRVYVADTSLLLLLLTLTRLLLLTIR